MASSSEFYNYDGEKPFTLVKWKVRVGSQLFYNSVILSYKYGESAEKDSKEPLMKYKSNIGGTVLELLVSEGDVVQPGAALLTVQPCTHPVIMKDLCAECGTDLRHLDRDNFAKLTAATTFSMVHIVPELKVSLEQAEKLGRDDEDRLLKNKKLVLLVDLDQTLIHTTNDNVVQDLPDVYHFQLYGQFSPWYHTKLRPGTQTFLENISKYYELHICTFGARLYAHKIAKILDPDGKYFSHRILSRDECFDATSKTGNLKALFPRGDAMVCIIDDREDVWNFAPNVIHVKPYCFFRNTGDINAPPPSNVPSKESKVSTAAENSNTTIICNEVNSNKSYKEEEINGIDDKPDQPSSDDSSIKKSSETKLPDNAKPEDTPQTDCDKNITLNKENGSKTTVNVNQTDSFFDVNKTDDYLLYLEEILVTVHKAYYDIYEKRKLDGKTSIPDLKTIVPDVRRKVLKGVNLVFSSVIPTNCVPENSRFWTLAESLGACVFKELTLDDTDERTTHVVASKNGTAKVNAAKRRRGIFIVSLDWLLCCAERWERAEERLFPLSKDCSPLLDIDKSYEAGRDPSFYDPAIRKTLKGCKRARSHSKRKSHKHEKSEEEKFSERVFFEAGLALSLDDIEDMDREVEEACSEESDKESDKLDASSDSSSAESLSSGDYPKGWKKPRKNDAPDLEEEAGDSSDAETIGSVDEEIADAVKKEFGTC